MEMYIIMHTLHFGIFTCITIFMVLLFCPFYTINKQTCGIQVILTLVPSAVYTSVNPFPRALAPLSPIWLLLQTVM